MQNKLPMIAVLVLLVLSLLANLTVGALLISSNNAQSNTQNQVNQLKQELDVLSKANSTGIVSSNTTTPTGTSTNTTTDTTPTTTNTQSTTKSYTSSIFDMSFNYDSSLGDATTTSTKGVYKQTGVLYCLTETITFSNSKVALTFTKGYQECTGATGSAGTLKNESVSTADGKAFQLIETGQSSDILISSSYTSSADQYRGVRIIVGTSLDNEPALYNQIKAITTSLKYNDTRMNSEAVQKTFDL